MPKRKLTANLESMYPISAALKDLLENGNIFRKQILKKKDTLLMPNMKVNEVHYMVKGLGKALWKNQDNEEEIFYLFDDDSFVVLLEEFLEGLLNESVYIVMLEESELYTLTKTQMDEIYRKYPEAVHLTAAIRILIQKRRDLHLSILMKKPALRYALFVKGYRNLHARMSVKEICTFLCICEKTYKTSKREMYLKSRKR